MRERVESVDSERTTYKKEVLFGSKECPAGVRLSPGENGKVSERDGAESGGALVRVVL
jgi:hypothetical protein